MPKTRGPTLRQPLSSLSTVELRPDPALSGLLVLSSHHRTAQPVARSTERCCTARLGHKGAQVPRRGPPRSAGPRSGPSYSDRPAPLAAHTPAPVARAPVESLSDRGVIAAAGSAAWAGSQPSCVWPPAAAGPPRSGTPAIAAGSSFDAWPPARAVLGSRLGMAFAALESGQWTEMAWLWAEEIVGRRLWGRPH